MTISVVHPYTDPSQSAYDLQLQINNQPSATYTIVPGTDLVLIGTSGRSVGFLG